MMFCDEPLCSHALTEYGLVIDLSLVWQVFIWTFRHLTDPVRHGPHTACLFFMKMDTNLENGTKVTLLSARRLGFVSFF